MPNKSLSEFETYLRREGLCEATINIYMRSCAQFAGEFGFPTAEKLQRHKQDLQASFAPKTANLHIQAINRWLKFLGLHRLTLSSVKVQHATFFNEGITLHDYETLKSYLRQEGQWRDYYAVWTMGATGVRVSELLQLTVAGVQASFYDVVGKGGKIRRVLLPTKLASETRRWLYDCRHQEGYVFLNKFGAPITARGLSQRLKDHALACGINPQSVHPHAFRHAFARAFLDAGGDIALLADIMGHSSIETTRIYLRRGAAEQRQLVDQVVTW